MQWNKNKKRIEDVAQALEFVRDRVSAVELNQTLNNIEMEKWDKWQNERLKDNGDLTSFGRSLAEQQKKINELEQKTPPSTTELINRIIELEAKMGKLWGLFTFAQSNGETKLTPQAKKLFDVLGEN